MLAVSLLYDSISCALVAVCSGSGASPGLTECFWLTEQPPANAANPAASSSHAAEQRAPSPRLWLRQASRETRSLRTHPPRCINLAIYQPPFRVSKQLGRTTPLTMPRHHPPATPSLPTIRDSTYFQPRKRKAAGSLCVSCQP